MVLIHIGLVWIVYAVVIAVLVAVSTIFVLVYQNPRDRAASITAVCIFTMTALLATVLLMPVDVALVSSTNSPKYGQKKDWATPDRVNGIVHTLKIVYYTLYSLDALLCLLVIPFTYFWYEEHDEELMESGEQTSISRLLASLRYTVAFIILVVILFLVGFFIPATKMGHKHMDLDFFKNILLQNNGEKALTFGLGLLITIGIFLYILYTASGMAMLPCALIQSAPSISSPSLAANTASQLEHNRERQRQLERQNEGRQGGLESRDRRELESLIREERTLIRRERLITESSHEHSSWLMKTWTKLCAVFRPVKLLFGLLLLIITMFIWVNMLITGIDKAKNSACKANCGYVLGHINIFQPLNWLLVLSSKTFPIDYIVYSLLVLLFFSASVIGIATTGIRFLWLTIFRIRKGHTSPQALLMATVMLALITFAMNYSFAMIVAPQYATFGHQTYCDLPSQISGQQPDCTEHPNAVRQCTELAENPAAAYICTPSVVSTFINRITISFPFFGAVDFWAQFAFLGVYLIVLITTLVRTPKLNEDDLDADLEEEEEEGLLASTGRRFNAAWQDITGNTKGQASHYGATDRNANVGRSTDV